MACATGSTPSGRDDDLPADDARPPPIGALSRRRTRRGEGRRVRAGVADGEDLPEMAVGVFPVEVLSPEAPVDLHVVFAAGRAAVGDARRLDAAENRVELDVAHAKAEMVPLEPLPVREVEGQRLVDVDGREGALRLPPGNGEQAGQLL